jgi:hypothetical protein
MIARTVAGHNLDPRRTSALLRCCAAGTFKPIVSKSRDYQAVRGAAIGPWNVDKNLFMHLSPRLFAIGPTAILDNRPLRFVLCSEPVAPMLRSFGPL